MAHISKAPHHRQRIEPPLNLVKMIKNRTFPISMRYAQGHWIASATARVAPTHVNDATLRRPVTHIVRAGRNRLDKDAVLIDK